MKKSSDFGRPWLLLACTVEDSRSRLRSVVVPALNKLLMAASDDFTRHELLMARNAVAGVLGRMTASLKGRAR